MLQSNGSAVCVATPSDRTAAARQAQMFRSDRQRLTTDRLCAELYFRDGIGAIQVSKQREAVEEARSRSGSDRSFGQVSVGSHQSVKTVLLMPAVQDRLRKHVDDAWDRSALLQHVGFPVIRMTQILQYACCNAYDRAVRVMQRQQQHHCLDQRFLGHQGSSYKPDHATQSMAMHLPRSSNDCKPDADRCDTYSAIQICVWLEAQGVRPHRCIGET